MKEFYAKRTTTSWAQHSKNSYNFLDDLGEDGLFCGLPIVLWKKHDLRNGSHCCFLGKARKQKNLSLTLTFYLICFGKDLQAMSWKNPMDPSFSTKTAGLILIGNELLSGKTRDTNGLFLIHKLRELGVSLKRVEIIPDDKEDIAQTVKRFSETYTWVFTSGGMGTTHDDATVPAVAQAFGVALVRHPQLLERLHGPSSEHSFPLTEHHFRLTEVPEGSVLLKTEDVLWPVPVMRNVYILPGVPTLFERKFLGIMETFRQPPFVLKQLFVRLHEEQIAARLEEIASQHPNVAIGSYPLFVAAPDGHRVKVTFEGKNATEVTSACAEAKEVLGEHAIVKET